jgi:hypothetical protein
VSEATIRAQIKTTLDTVSNKGTTHNRLRWAVKQSDWETIAQATISSVVQIRWWEIVYRGFSQTEPHIGRDAAQIRIHNFDIHGYLGLDDSTSTETTFSALAIAVCDALDDDSTLNAAAMSVWREPTQLAINEVLMAGVLCHHAAIMLQVVEYA